jgi:hypothetical protein
MRRKVGPTALVALAGSALALSTLLTVSVAAAQEYGESVGDLMVGYYLRVSGDGFSPGSEVRIQLTRNDTGETTNLGAAATDRGGTLAASVALPEGLEPGTYVLTATGVTTDGLTRTLSTELQNPFSGPSLGQGDPSGLQPALVTGLPVLALVLAGGGWWWLSAARKRRKAGRPDLEGRADHRLFPRRPRIGRSFDGIPTSPTWRPRSTGSPVRRTSIRWHSPDGASRRPTRDGCREGGPRANNRVRVD